MRKAHVIYTDEVMVGIISHGQSRDNIPKDFGKIISFYMHPI